MRRKPGSGSQKGSSWERKICTILSLWVSDQKRQDCLWRSAMSGGRANLTSRRGQEGQFSAQAGDLTAISKEGRLLVFLFCIDGKAYTDIQMDRAVFGTTGAVFSEQWIKLKEESKRFHRRPMMVIKQNFRDPILVVDRRGEQVLLDGLVPGKKLVAVCYFPRIGARCYLFHEMLLRVDFNIIRKKYPEVVKREIL